MEFPGTIRGEAPQPNAFKPKHSGSFPLSLEEGYGHASKEGRSLVKAGAMGRRNAGSQAGGHFARVC